MIDDDHKDHKNFVKIIVELSNKTQPNTFNQAVLSLMTECTFAISVKDTLGCGI